MSIRDQIRLAVAAGKLRTLPRRTPSDPVERVMLIGDEIWQLLQGPFTSLAHGQRIGTLHADLEAFVRGDVISMGLIPFQHKSAYMGRLHPKGQATWDIRSRDPDPGLRVFGRFAAKDVFVALTWAPRSVSLSWSKRVPLAERRLNWRLKIHDCEEQWNLILPDVVPLVGEKVEDYVSKHAFSV